MVGDEMTDLLTAAILLSNCDKHDGLRCTPRAGDGDGLAPPDAVDSRFVIDGWVFGCVDRKCRMGWTVRCGRAEEARWCWMDQLHLIAIVQLILLLIRLTCF